MFHPLWLMKEDWTCLWMPCFILRNRCWALIFGAYACIWFDAAMPKWASLHFTSFTLLAAKNGTPTGIGNQPGVNWYNRYSYPLPFSYVHVAKIRSHLPVTSKSWAFQWVWKITLLCRVIIPAIHSSCCKLAWGAPYSSDFNLAQWTVYAFN